MQVQPSKAQQHKTPLETFLKSPKINTKEEKNLTKGKEMIMETIPEAMEEEPESIDLEVLDLTGIEESCTDKDYTTIPEQ